MKYAYTLLLGAIGFGLVLVPVAASQAVTNIRLQPAPNAVAVEWNPPAGVSVARYRIYYARESILQNNGRFLDREETAGNETSLLLFDLKNRGFSEGSAIFVTVTALDEAGKEHPSPEEASATVIVTAAPAKPTQTVPPPLLEIPQIQPRTDRVILSEPSDSGASRMAEPPPDLTPPEDPGNLRLTPVVQNNGLYTVHASWDASLNTAGDLLSYNLYESGNGGARFVGPTALRATVLGTAIADVPAGGALTVKITAMDRNGNESKGIIKTISLPETGGAAILLSLAGALAIARRRTRH